VSARSVEFLVPGDLASATGGYGYDRRIIAGLREAGWRVTVHALDASFPFPTAAALEHVNGVCSGIPDGALVVVDGLALGAMPEVAERQARRVQIIALVHHPLALETGLSRESASRLEQSERAALRSARHIVVTSEATADALGPYGVDRARISVIVPGTDEAPLAVGSSDGSMHLLCVATLTPRKGHDLLIHALAALAALPWRLTCVGSLTRGAADTIAALRTQIQDAGLEKRVSLVGEMTGDALDAAYQSADLFVLPTRYEGYGMVVAEALARGMPVISTRTGAIADLVGTSAGLLVPPGDGDAIRDALTRALSDASVRASLREAARRAREHLPRWPQSCASMSQVLEEAARVPVPS
jgi:glycosyltransferase involved in cell wall biosynthesis